MKPIRYARPVAAARRKLGISQATLASYAGISRKHLSAIECGHNRPSADVLLALAAALAVEPRELTESESGEE